MSRVILATGKLVTVDDDIFSVALSWGLSIKTDSDGYQSVIFSGGPHKLESLARYLLGLSKGDGKIADHIDRDPFNNVKDNLRVASAQLSVQNRNTWGTSKHKGVYKNGKNWGSSIMVDGRKIFLGTFPSQELAAFARKNAEHIYWNTKKETK